jgi:DNA-binding beta-propeller fold protein YncE
MQMLPTRNSGLFRRIGFTRGANAATLLALLAVACLMNGTPAGCQRAPLMTVPAPNWNDPPPDAVREAAAADALPVRPPAADEIAFTFNLAASAKSTSAGVYDAKGTLVRMLWSARPYAAGTHHDLWDGKDDYGNPAAPGSYTVKLLAGNVHYDWDGVIGVTEDSLSGPNNWDGAGSFPSSLAFVNGKAYVAGGYNESRLEAFVFDEKDPYTVAPLNLALQSGGQFEYASTDGKRLYFASLMAFTDTDNAVVAFDPDGQPYSFPQGTEMRPPLTRPAYFSNVQMRPPLALKHVRGVDVGSNQSMTISGLAVQRNGSLLATSQGGRGGAHLCESLDSISLWDKNTGAQAGTIHGISNPHKMAFDLNGNLWVIEGGPISEWYWDSGARLARISDVGGKNDLTEPIQGLENPVDVAVNPVNGHLFVADGGSSQQVKEFDPQTGKLLSTVGTPGGYGQGSACNANITPTTFWLDLNMRETGVTRPWISIDDHGDLWVGDYSANRILEFHQGNFVREIEMGRWLGQMSIPRNDPTRLFGGINGMLEYQIDYSKPLVAGDQSTQDRNGAWRTVRNWFPCFLEAERGQQEDKNAQMISTETLANGRTYGSIVYHGGPFVRKNALVQLPTSGKLSFVNNRFPDMPTHAWFDPAGNIYRGGRSGTVSAPIFAVRKFAITGYDAQGFPTWDSGPLIASITPDLSKGNPVTSCWYDGCDFMPTTGGIIPIYAGRYPVPPSTPATPVFHLGGLPVGGSATEWQTQPEKPLRYPDGRGTYNSLTHETNTSNGAHAINRDIFTGYNGNWQQFSCQYFHYREDGLLVGQFGWRGSDDYPFIGTGGGYPDPRLGQPLAPGYCGNTMMFKVVQVGKDYYIYSGDEGYRAGLHRWHISNLDSIHEQAGAATLGGTVELKPLP